MPTVTRIDVLLSTLNATDVGTLESIAAKLRHVQEALAELDQPELAARAADAVAALNRGDIAEFKRGRAFLQSKIGHLREPSPALPGRRFRGTSLALPTGRRRFPPRPRVTGTCGAKGWTFIGPRV